MASGQHVKWPTQVRRYWQPLEWGKRPVWCCECSLWCWWIFDLWHWTQVAMCPPQDINIDLRPNKKAGHQALSGLDATGSGGSRILHLKHKGATFQWRHCRLLWHHLLNGACWRLREELRSYPASVRVRVVLLSCCHSSEIQESPVCWALTLSLERASASLDLASAKCQH